MNHHQVVKLEEMDDMEQILQTICAELNGNRSSIVNILRSIRANNSIDRDSREGYRWSYTLDNGAETNHCNHMVQFGFMEVCWCRTFDISIALLEFQDCEKIHSFEMTFERYEKGAPLVVQDFKLSIQNRSVIR